DERSRFLGARRQTSKIEVNAANERPAIRLRRGLELFVSETGANKGVDWICDAGNLGDFGFLRRHKRPVSRVDGALLDPGANLLLLGHRELEPRLRRRHEFRFVVADDAPPGFALLRFFRDDWRCALTFGVHGLGLIESQFRLPRLFVKAVAGETVLGE